MSDNTKICAECGLEIEGSYYIVGDNFLEANYFDSDDINCFCCKDCLCSFLSVLEVDENGEIFPC